MLLEALLVTWRINSDDEVCVRQEVLLNGLGFIVSGFCSTVFWIRIYSSLYSALLPA